MVTFLIISLILLIGGADKLLDATEDLAKKLETSEFIIGLTIVALGTSAPEIFVGLQVCIKIKEKILAVGAIIGSNISNIALIFGIACVLEKFNIHEKNATRQKTVYSFNFQQFY